jgi:hypothetical protein
MPARLEHEQAPDGVQALSRVSPFLQDRGPLERRDSARDDAERLARGVVVDRFDP